MRAIQSSEAGSRRPRLVDRLRAIPQLAAAWVAAKIRRRRGRAQLARLDDHLLRDIGLTRHDVGGKSESSFADDR